MSFLDDNRRHTTKAWNNFVENPLQVLDRVDNSVLCVANHTSF